MKLIIAGGRNFNSYVLLSKVCDEYLDSISNAPGTRFENIVCVSGRAEGADRLGERYAVSRGFSQALFPANWRKEGRRAGFIRNARMAEYADALLAFWDGKSPGTANMLKVAADNGLARRVCFFSKRLMIIQDLSPQE